MTWRMMMTKEKRVEHQAAYTFGVAFGVAVCVLLSIAGLIVLVKLIAKLVK
jgi:hypothetical protein